MSRDGLSTSLDSEDRKESLRRTQLSTAISASLEVLTGSTGSIVGPTTELISPNF